MLQESLGPLVFLRLAGDRGYFERLFLRSLVKVRVGGEMVAVERNSESFL